MPNVYLPQILWHSKDNKRSDRIYSLDIQPYPNYYSVKKLNRKYELFIKYLKEKGKIDCNKFDTLEENQEIISDLKLPSNNNYNNNSSSSNKNETLKLDKALNQGNQDNIINTVIGNTTDVSNDKLLDNSNNKLSEIKTNISSEDHQEHNSVNKKKETNSSFNDNILHNKTPIQSNQLLTPLQDDKTKKKKPIKFNIATCGADEFVHLWRIFIKDDISIKCLGRFIGHSGEINCVRFNKNGRYIASGGEDKFLYIWEKSKKPKNIPLGYDISFLDYKEWWNIVGSFRCSGVINSIIWSNNDTLYIANEDNNINIIDFVKNTNCKVQVLEGHSGIIQGISFDNNYEYLASLSADQTLKIWKKKNDGKSWKLENSIKNIRRDELDKLNNACITCNEYDFPDKNNTDKYESNPLKQENKKLINSDLLEQDAYKKKIKNKKEQADGQEEEANHNEDVEEQQTDVGEEHIEEQLNNNIVINSNNLKMNNSNTLKMNNSNTLKMNNSNSLKMNNSNSLKMNNSNNQENNFKPYQQIHTKFMSKKHLEEGEEEQEEEEEERKFKRSLFSSEEMLPSFFRRIDFSPNGEFLITPSGIQFQQVEKVNEKNNRTDENAKPNYEIKAYSCFYIYHKNLFLKYNIPFFTIFSQTSHFLVAKFNYNTFKLRTEQNILKRCYEHFLNNSSDVNDEDNSNSNKKRKISDDHLKLNELIHNDKLIKLNYEKTLLYNHIDIPDDVSQNVSSTISESDVEFNEDKASLKELSPENCLMKNLEKNEDGNDEDNAEENVEEKKEDLKDETKEEEKEDLKDETKEEKKIDSKDDSKDETKEESKDETREKSQNENQLKINNKLNTDEEVGKNDIMDKYNDNNDNVEILNEQDVLSEHKDKKEERFIYTLGTFDGSVYFYDSEILDIPISIVKNIHLCPITDICWNNLGNVCACSSSDGYVSFYHFNDNELGNIKSYKNYYLDKKCNDLTFDQNYFKNTFYDEVEFLNKDESNDYTSSEDEFDDHNLIPPKEETKVKRINLIVGNAANFVLSQNTKK
ncbi:chromosome assembly factor 1 [Plasmodium sp. gorilla clade G2]|uniref:chromosome assembly factor 1 n=1 Tax=Plasmodium sp. gorilla clade G2 TaxID=880535 RepID=UPI000D205407|nr:chromosome assembly factor 1 [Plasmodium sp. gorilla clade G2]SOV11538.1 chromosome assembly factor 1 [Plasmodium sp. gorilla clade G2]